MIPTKKHSVLIMLLYCTYLPLACMNYYVSSVDGNDAADGLSVSTAWKLIDKLNTVILQAGDSILFARGSSYENTFYVLQSGTAENPIVISAYGDASLPAPAFTNKIFEQDNFGNCIRVKGSHIVIENLYFHETTVYVDGNYTTDGGWAVWEMGALYLDKGSQYCIIRNNEFYDCPAAIRTYCEYSLITHNYIHDCNRVMKEWTWGPLGIWFGADNQEACYNRIFNYSAVDDRIAWAGNTTGGADGGAFEVDDARYPKSNIHIHHNYTRDCQGFLEVTWTDVLQNPEYKDFKIHHNIADDYQTFTAIWQGKNFSIEHNTIVRRKKNVVDWGVFNITGNDTKNYIRNNIIVTEQNIPIFNTGINTTSFPRNIIENNLYFAASGTINLGKEGPGKSLVQGNPLFVNYLDALHPEDYALLKGSPALAKGQNLGYVLDFFNNPIPTDEMPDLGAIQWQDETNALLNLTSEKVNIQRINNTHILIQNQSFSNKAYIYNLLGMLEKIVSLQNGNNWIQMSNHQLHIVHVVGTKGKII